ncbi:MAG: triose-phosphate isomerase [Rickettsiales bacterium]|nr:triose-phosphate isomerase [Rickettsiales bacterium]
MKYIVGNWKMNLLSKDSIELSSSINEFLKDNKVTNQVVICPSFTLLPIVSMCIEDKKFCLGAQDCSVAERGAYTGDVSGEMLSDLGCKYVIVGHSERRRLCKETSEVVREKAEKVYTHNMTPIICVGESLADRDSGRTFEVLAEQVLSSLPEIQGQELIIAYEPVWAIGSGMKPQESEIESVAIFLRELIHRKFVFTKRVKILYGGSVNENNCYSIINLENIDGLLIGNASLESQSFINIIKCCKEVA